MAWAWLSPARRCETSRVNGLPARIMPDEVVADDLMRLVDGGDQVLAEALERLREAAALR